MEQIVLYIAVIATCLFAGKILFSLVYPACDPIHADRWFTDIETVCIIIAYMSWLSWFYVWVL